MRFRRHCGGDAIHPDDNVLRGDKEMTVITYETDITNRCGGCKYFEPRESYPYLGRCICQYDRIKVKDRTVTSKKCSQYSRKEEQAEP